MLPNTVALCERDDGSIYLVDAGFSSRACADPSGVLGRGRVLALGVRLAAHDSIASQMTRAGLDPGRVTTIIATHLHFDHIGGVADFPNAEVLVTREEWHGARTSGSLSGYRKQDLDLLQRLRVVDLHPRCVAGFARSAALDAELTVADTSGHSAGHLAVLIEDGDQRWFHAGDSAYQMAELHSGRVSPLGRALAHDLPRLRRTRERLRLLAAEGRIRVVLSHDAETFGRLPLLGTALSP